MASTRKIIRAFLASPGDLEPERKAIRNVVDEFNETWANALGYQVELVGWEETISGVGRPQHLINQDLDRCDLFIGMIWKRWGTPPDKNGQFSSGFQEEFERSMARREETGSPEVSLFFKNVSSEFAADPGEDLKKVLDFRAKTISEKRILFQSFDESSQVEKLARKRLAAYVNSVRETDEVPVNVELRAKTFELEEQGSEKGTQSSPLSVEGFEFLQNFIGNLGNKESLESVSAGDVARFRLLANSISKPGNEDINLGTHDINILFAEYGNKATLGRKERTVLVRLAFQHLDSENVPLWCWYSSLANDELNPAVLSSYAGADDNERVGAISVLTLLAFNITTDQDALLSRDTVIESWFSESTSGRVRTAALRYLAKCGGKSDLAIAEKEYNRADYGTSRTALECIIQILLRSGDMRKAQQTLLESQFETLNIDLTASILEGFESLEAEELLLGLEHRNPEIRLHAFKLLDARGRLDIEVITKLTEDSNARVRMLAVMALLDKGVSLGVEDVKKKLVLPKQQTGETQLGLSDISVLNSSGEMLFEKYQLNELKKLSETELKKIRDLSLSHEEPAYFVLAEKYFGKHGQRLRQDVDDKFKTYFESIILRIEKKFEGKIDIRELKSSIRDLEEFVRKKITRMGLDVLCRVGKEEDLSRIRSNLREGYVGVSILDAQYLARRGSWFDIPLLANTNATRLSGVTLERLDADSFSMEIAKTIVLLSKKRPISDLLSLSMPPVILKNVIELSAEARFATISRTTVLELFDHSSSEVRKSTALMAVRAFPVKRIKSILEEYVHRDSYRYYNVIHWLDLGVSLVRAEAKRVALAASR